MTARERAQALASAAAGWPDLGLTDAGPLLELLRAELGHEDILDDFQSVGSTHAKAIPPGVILHVVAGNTPMAALQSVIRGLLLGGRNLCKIPSAGLPDVERFRDRLPAALAERLEIARDLSDAWLQTANAVIAHGSDETIAAIRARVSIGQIFLGHGHKVSAGLVWDDPASSLDLAARDVCLFDQKGCLSLHTIYVNERRCGSAKEYGRKLGQAISAYLERHPPGAITDTEMLDIQHIRASYSFRAANDPRVALFESPGSLAWTVVCEDDPIFASSCLNRVVYVKPLPDDLAPSFVFVRPHLSALALWPFDLQAARRWSDLGFTRVCALGQSQRPPWTWRPDGVAILSRLVSWRQIG